MVNLGRGTFWLINANRVVFCQSALVSALNLKSILNAFVGLANCVHYRAMHFTKLNVEVKDMKYFKRIYFRFEIMYPRTIPVTLMPPSSYI